MMNGKGLTGTGLQDLKVFFRHLGRKSKKTGGVSGIARKNVTNIQTT